MKQTRSYTSAGSTQFYIEEQKTNYCFDDLTTIYNQEEKKKKKQQNITF